MKFLVTVWQDIIIHNDEKDELLQPSLVERVRYILSRNVLSCIHLYNCYSDLPEQLKIMFIEIFRDRTLHLLSAKQYQKWDGNHLDAILKLLINDQIQWPLEDYFKVLDIVSQCVDLGLLTKFHEFLEFGFNTFKEIDESKLSILCKQWYRNLLDRASNFSNSDNNNDYRDKFAFMAFSHISKVYPYIGKIPVWQTLLEIAVSRVKHTSEDVIFSTVDKVVEKLVELVVEAFIAMVKDKLNSSMCIADNQLMAKIKLICNCSTDELKVPTRSSEDILCHIMTRLQSTFDSQTFSENFHLSLLNSGNFWIQILKATGSVDKLHSHPQINEVRNAISHLTEILSEESISISLLQELLNKDDNFLLTYFGFAIIPSINKNILTNIREKYRIYGLGLDYLNSFYTEFCPQSIVFDVKEYIDDIYEMHQRKNATTLKDTSLNDYWGMHTDILRIAEDLYKYRKSQTFKNCLSYLIEEEEEDTRSVKWIVEIMPKVYESYCRWCRTYLKWETEKFSFAKILWNKVPDITVELDLMDGILKIERSPKLLRTLTDISKVAQWIEKLKQLTEVVCIFKIQEDKDEDSWLEETLSDLRDDETLTLGRLCDSFDLLHEKLQVLDDACWALIKELSLSGDFLNWLRSIADHDIKNLINGVDDHSDERLIQEDTVSSLIHVKQFLLPIMLDAENFSLEEFLKEIRNVAETNSSLATAISNRGEVTKEKISNAVKIGVYEFKWTSKDDVCSATLSYSSKNGTKMTYSMSDLQDLRGRALLIAKPASTIYGDKEESKDIMNEFVLQVDKAQSIIDEFTKLIEAGHFNYREYSKEVTGLEQLNSHLKALEKDLKACKGPNRKICEKTCETLVRYVNFGAKLPPIRNPKDALNIKNHHYKVLCDIGIRLKNIFDSLSKNPIPFEECGERIVSDVVYPGKLFVAACSDRSVIPNIIMSLYANSKFYPNAWQLLICTPSTTSEEIAIFIKRCSFASNNGYKDHLFCMANLEVLDYKLQYYVVKQIRSLLDKAKIFYLALICCQEPGMHHHILDQFSEDVRVTNGLSTKSMKESYRAICEKVICVTSDLSGQGKTEWIKQESYRKMVIPRTFLINDGADFGKLVRQFQKFPIRKTLDSLHINIISADNPWEVNMFLFQLLTFGIVSHQSDIGTLPDIHVFIEVASSVDNRLAKSLPIVSYLDSPHLRFNFKQLIVSNEIYSPIQVVCQYLNAHENASLDECEIAYRQPTHKPLPTKRCQQLLSKYFFNTITPDLLSYRFLEIFINVFANQLIRLSCSSFFTVENLRLMIKENNIRLTLFNTLMDVSKDFATRSIQTKNSQMQALSDSPDQLGNITSWDDSNHLLVFFMSQTPDSICALYRDKAKVLENVQTLLKSQHIASDKWQLEDYRTMPMDLLLLRLESIARKTHHKIDYPPYALSADNLLKMALILLRTRANVPVVICGEAGCGKTSLISFLARVVEAEFHALNLHAGITEEMIIQFMEDSQINVHHHEIKRFDEQRSNLVYEVKPLPDQILDYVWDYGVLEPSDERKYIEIMTKTQLDNNLNHEMLADLLFTSQQFIRDVEEKYTVSLRDVKRAITLIKFFYNSLQDRPRVKKEVPYPPTKPNIVLQVIRKEQEDYVNRMTLPFNTAKNDALLENVLVMIVYLIPHQGSSSSTSDGIIKVFEKAKKFQDTSSDDFPVVSVVLLDEVGLAETSPHNPLKVLHSLLEPSYPAEGPTVSVVGISNWRLDNSKSSRALLVQRPQLTLDDLVDIAVRLLNDESTTKVQPSSVRHIATAYLEYAESGQEIPNFHGLRDYYSLVKNLSSQELTPKNIQMSLARNFGGTNNYSEICKKYFGNVIDIFNSNPNWTYEPISTEFLINANLEDEFARHLMVIGNSDSIVNLLVYQLRQRELEPVVIFGSQFPKDQNDQGIKDADPPLLNRFEKQRMTMRDTFTSVHEELVEELTSWAKRMSTITSMQLAVSRDKFTLSDLFIGFNPDETIQSLVIDIKETYQWMDSLEILEKCKECLIAIASSDGIVRAEKSALEPDEIEHCKKVYFKDQHHDHLEDYFSSLLDTEPTTKGYQIIINTFSNINTDIAKCLKDVFTCQVLKLSTFKTEAEFQNQIKRFWFDSPNKAMLVLQCDLTTANAGCIKLAKFLIEQYRLEYFTKMEQAQESQEQENFIVKHWKQVTIETLVRQEKPLSSLLYGSLCEIIEETYPFEEILKQELYITEKIPGNQELVNALKTRTKEWIEQEDSLTDWQYHVASSKKSLYPHSSFVTALLTHIRAMIRKPLARILCALERFSAIETFINLNHLKDEQQEQLSTFWKEMFADRDVINIDLLQQPKPDIYSLPGGVHDLKFPFSYYFMKQIDRFKRLYEEEIAKLHEDPENLDADGTLLSDVIEDYNKGFANNIFNSVKHLKSSPLEWNRELYFEDFISVICSNEPVSKMIDPEDHHFEKFLVYEIAEQKLYELESIEINQLPEWQHEATKIISLCTKLTEASDLESFHLLQICSDLISTDVISLDAIKEIVKVAYSGEVQQIFTSKFVKTGFQILDGVKDYYVPRKLFMIKCLDILPITSNIRLDLYNKLFSKDPFPLIDNRISDPIEINNSQLGDIDISELTNRLNYDMEVNKQVPLIHSLRIYFLRALRRCCEFSLDDVKRFCKSQEYTLPWLANLSWEDNNRANRFPFNPYRSMEDYNNLETTFASLHNFNNKGPFEKNFFAKFKKKNSNLSHLALMGLIFSRLHAIRASRGWSENETSTAKTLQESVESVDHLSTIYKTTIKNLISNEHKLLRLTEAINNQDLLIKSVIGHIIALNASIRHDSSPLANLLQNLHYCTGLFIPATPSDEESIVLSAVLRGGGLNHVAAEGQTKMDNNPLRIPLSAKNQTGYIGEPINQEPAQSVRMMSPTSYRILHLFVHVIIGAWAHAPLAKDFLQKNNKIATDSGKYCMDHIKNDWMVLRRILNTSDENLALVLHSILDSMVQKPCKMVSLKTSAERDEWETEFKDKYVTPQVINITETAVNFQNKLAEADKSQDNVNIIEAEINQTLAMDNNYQLEHLPKMWRFISDISYQSLHAHYLSDEDKHSKKYPFLAQFFKHSEKLSLIKHLLPIVRFVQILSSRLEYRLSRDEAEEQTFGKFIDNEEGEMEFEYSDNNILRPMFEDFAESWNEIIDKVKNYQCHPLPDQPRINLDSRVALGLIEPVNSGVYLCAILEYLIGLQNEFLEDVMAIPYESWTSLKFLDEASLNSNETVTSTSQTEKTLHHYIRSIRLENAKPNNFINYEWNDDLLQYSQRNLQMGRGDDVAFDLQKIESELARQLVFGKVHINTIDESNLYLEQFNFHLELFKGYMRILSDIKVLIPQKPISNYMKSNVFNLSTTSSTKISSTMDNLESMSFESASKLLSCLEILLCFVKRKLISDSEILISEFVKQWAKLSVLVDNELFMNILKVDLRLKHVVALYELIEEQVANKVITYVDDKYAEPLTSDLEKDISDALDFDITNDVDSEETDLKPMDDDSLIVEENKKVKKIPAEAFASTLKRFIFRYLMKESIKEDHPMWAYLKDGSLNLWSAQISEELVDDFFPESLMTCHSFEAYRFVFEKVEHKEQNVSHQNVDGPDNSSSSNTSSNRGSHSSRGSRGSRGFHKGHNNVPRGQNQGNSNASGGQRHSEDAESSTRGR
ncbi:1481_t:CDS:10, partial [Racocetra fulgida]